MCMSIKVNEQNDHMKFQRDFKECSCGLLLPKQVFVRCLCRKENNCCQNDWVFYLTQSFSWMLLMSNASYKLLTGTAYCTLNTLHGSTAYLTSVNGILLILEKKKQPRTRIKIIFFFFTSDMHHNLQKLKKYHHCLFVVMPIAENIPDLYIYCLLYYILIAFIGKSENVNIKEANKLYDTNIVSLFF